MTGLNHALAGGLIGKFVPLPLVMPLALASHFILDMLPHYGIDQEQRDKSLFWRIFFSVDALATFCLAVYAIQSQHYAMFLGGLFATMPDYLWVGRIIKTRSFNLSSHSNSFTRWHANIQRFERPWGIWIELPLTLILFYVVMIRLW
jgi:hypothetical protein